MYKRIIDGIVMLRLTISPLMLNFLFNDNKSLNISIVAEVSGKVSKNSRDSPSCSFFLNISDK